MSENEKEVTVVRHRQKLPRSLFDGYSVWVKLWEKHPMTKITPSDVADVLDAVVAIERKARRDKKGQR